jgi:hypothetical protein
MYIQNEATISINAPILGVYKWIVFTPLEKQLYGTKKLPAVVATKSLNNIEIGKSGHLRQVCLADGNTATEEHTFIDDIEKNTKNKYFKYKVNDYTLKIAKNIEYAIGEWWLSADGNNTNVKWRYSFKLNDKKILGRLGLAGRVLFDVFFLKTSYNEFMISTLKQLKKDLEKL